MAMFDNAKVGDWVYGIDYGSGEILGIYEHHICAEFWKGKQTFTFDGYRRATDVNRTFFWKNPDEERAIKLGMFSDIKLGDKIYSYTYGQFGKISEIKEFGRTPIVAILEEGDALKFNYDGTEYDKQKNPTVFWNKPKFEIPEKPFDLKAEYKKLKRVNFIQDKENFYLIYYGDDVYSTEKSEKWNFGLHDEYCSIGTTYYSGDNLSNFIKLLNDNKITFEQLEQVIKEVENED